MTEIADLYDVADDDEATVLDDLRRRAGHIWECYGPGEEPELSSHWTNVAEDDKCGRCGTPRRIGETWNEDDRARVLREETAS